MIELQTINEDNFELCFNLKASVENESFIDSVTYSLAEAWVFYKDTRPFLIDDAFQKKGLGTKAAKACIHYLKNEYGAKRISAPVELKNIVARRFWGKLGFTFSYNAEDGYIFMRLTL